MNGINSHLFLTLGYLCEIYFWFLLLICEWTFSKQMYEVVDHVKLVVTLARNEYIFITNYFDTSRSVVEWVGAQCVALNFFNLLLFILLFFFFRSIPHDWKVDNSRY